VSGASAYLTNVRLVSVDAISAYGLASTGADGPPVPEAHSVLKNVEIVVKETRDISALTGAITTSKVGVHAEGGSMLTLEAVSVSVEGGLQNAGIFVQGYQGLTIRNGCGSFRTTPHRR
jgi:hypothetical protein